MTSNPAIFRSIAKAFYETQFMDSITVITCYIYIASIFQHKILSLYYLYNTLRNGFTVMNIALFYYLIIAMGQAFANLSIVFGYDLNYRNFISSFVGVLL